MDSPFGILEFLTVLSPYASEDAEGRFSGI
jgi:hypothetical protein